MKVTNKQYNKHRGIWMLICPLCNDVLALNVQKDMLPDYMICTCDANGNKKPAYELFVRNGENWIRRNKFPRFIGRVVKEGASDIEGMEILDDCPDVDKLASAMRKAGEFLKKYRS